MLGVSTKGNGHRKRDWSADVSSISPWSDWGGGEGGGEGG